MVEIKEVTKKQELKKFVSFPVKLYKDCEFYVPSLYGDEIKMTDKNKNFNLDYCDCKCFLAYKDGKVVGRVMGINSHTANENALEKEVRFSRFDAINDLEVFDALIKAVEDYGKSYGAKIIHGPWGFNDTDREGMLIDGFDKISTYATNYSYPYYHENLEKLGFTPESKWEEWRFIIPSEPDKRISELAKKIEKRLNVKDVARTMSVKKILKKYADQFFETYNESYGHLDGFIPFEGKAKDSLLSQFATIINERYLSFIVNEEGEVVAFGVMLPSLAKALVKSRGKLFPTGFIGVLSSINKPKALEMALFGVKEKYKNSGVTAIIIANIMKNIIEDKIVNVESNPMLDTNFLIRQQWKFVDKEVIKKRQTYKKEIVK
ncbi:MAG: N-acetyltransferase [Clostridiales bacterium]|nr:N-acetyltransferase [Clostridiales bacterium]